MKVRKGASEYVFILAQKHFHEMWHPSLEEPLTDMWKPQFGLMGARDCTGFDTANDECGFELLPKLLCFSSSLIERVHAGLYRSSESIE